MGKIERENLNNEKSYSTYRIESKSQLANVLFTTEIARRLDGTGVVANYLHPGAVRTDVSRYQPWWARVIISCVTPFLKTQKSGAQTSLALALDPDFANITGKHFEDCIDTTKWVWNESMRITRLQ